MSEYDEIPDWSETLPCAICGKSEVNILSDKDTAFHLACLIAVWEQCGSSA